MVVLKVKLFHVKSPVIIPKEATPKKVESKVSVQTESRN